MLRRIVDINKLDPEILALLKAKYPTGYDEKDIVRFRNAQNESIEAVEVRTEDTIYMVKVSKKLVDTLEGLEKDLDNTESDTETPSGGRDALADLANMPDGDFE